MGYRGSTILTSTKSGSGTTNSFSQDFLSISYCSNLAYRLVVLSPPPSWISALCSSTYKFWPSGETVSPSNPWLFERPDSGFLGLGVKVGLYIGGEFAAKLYGSYTTGQLLHPPSPLSGLNIPLCTVAFGNICFGWPYSQLHFPFRVKPVDIRSILVANPKPFPIGC